VKLSPQPHAALGVGVVEHETGGEFILHPVHRRADQIQHRAAIDEESAAGRFDALVKGTASLT
jgi:hypothetical protein